MNSQTPLTNDQIQQKAPSAFAGQPFERQSDRYAFVPTSAVIDGMRQSGFLPVEVFQSHSRIPGKEMFTKHMIRFQTQAEIVSLGDSLLEMVLINSHDGTSSYELAAGLKRLACLNGLMVSQSLSESVKIRHTGNILNQVADATQRLLTDAPRIATMVKAWAGIVLTPAEQMILAEAAHELRFEQGSNMQTAIEPSQLLESRRQFDRGDDLWSVFNRIQENTIRGKIRGRVNGRRVRSASVTGISENVKLNRALWSLAEKTAELKA